MRDYETHPIGTADKIKKLERAIELYEAERTRFKHAYPEITGEYFISGKAGNIDKNMLPAYLLICPAYGSDWSQV